MILIHIFLFYCFFEKDSFFVQMLQSLEGTHADFYLSELINNQEQADLSTSCIMIIQIDGSRLSYVALVFTQV